ncbi:unnamed protein product [Adineta ricciae]|uniref:Uncharacterized protein n=1 Tax=Adineta ricciae TaxID=249248 RepID=A0A814QS40_ADIRI|nr:unnamed protein product [Adineta ricciae]CAF1124140.1 unnamed protein product [Adineta ricciae]
MTIRQQYANEELVHKLRSMLNDLPTLRTRAVKKLKHWREAAIKRLLIRQRELEKGLLDKFERLEFDTQLFVEKIERKKANQQRHWQTEPLDYHNKSEIDRISTNLRSIREELEQSKYLLAGATIDYDTDDLLSEEILPGKLVNTSKYGGSLSSKVATNKVYENNDLGSELKRVLEICTSPQRPSSSLSADEMKYGFVLPKPKVLFTSKNKKTKTKKFDAHRTNLGSKVKLSNLQSLDHVGYAYDSKSKPSTPKPKQGSQTDGAHRRHSRTIANVPIQQKQQQNVSTSTNDQATEINGGNTNHKLFAFESFDDSIRRFQRLREIRKNLRTKYDDHSQSQSVESTRPSSANGIDNTESISITKQKPVKNSNRPLSNGVQTIPPTPLTIKSIVNTNKIVPRKNGETRQTAIARESVNIPIERILPVTTTPPATSDPKVVELYDQAANSVRTESPTTSSTISNTRDRRYRSRTLDAHQIQAVDNQIYGCPPSSSKIKQQNHQRSESNRHRSHRLSLRRSSEDPLDKQSQHKHNHEHQNDLNETWLNIDQEHWTNLLENGWRPTLNTPGVTSVAVNELAEHTTRGDKKMNVNGKPLDLYEQISKTEYAALFDQLEFAYTRTINLGNEFWRFLEIDGDHHLCLYHQLNKQFIMYKPDLTLLCFPWPYDGIVDISWSKSTQNWIVATQTQIIICNRSFSKIFQSIDINGDWPKRITSCQSSIFHTHKIPANSSISSSSSSSSSSYYQSSTCKDRPQFLLERYDYKLKSLGKHILESSTIWDIEADDLAEHLAILCDVALIIFDYQLNLLKQIEVTGFKVTTDHFGGWLIADYNASCLWQIKRNEYTKANKILHVERPWSVILDRSTWTLVTLSETQNRAKRLLFFTMKNVPSALSNLHSARSQSQLSGSVSSSMSNSLT